MYDVDRLEICMNEAVGVPGKSGWERVLIILFSCVAGVILVGGISVFLYFRFCRPRPKPDRDTTIIDPQSLTIN